MTTYATANPFEPWSTTKMLQAPIRDEKPEDWYFGQFFINQMRSDTEWIDFEKLPIRSRTLAPFVKPMGRGHGMFTDKQTGFRFKPANVVVEDAVDPLRPLTFQPGIGESSIRMGTLSPMQRLELIKAQMMGEFMTAVERRWEWMKAKAIIDGKVQVTYLDGTSVLVDFQRAAGHTEVLTAGNYFGDAGVSILDKFQSIVDTMNNASFGGMPTCITMGGLLGTIVRKDAEILSHLDKNIAGATVVVERGIISGAPGGGKVYKIGTLLIGGAGGQSIEMWVNNETYDVGGAQIRYVGDYDAVFTSTPQAINGYECFGMIVDRDAAYQAIPIFPKNYLTGERVKVENMSAESAPLFVPINPNATYKLTARVA
ncbi:major capsid protein [Sphingomonas sp. RB3P16]|uniref:major capsid protein n=1 Tax=Parasphingomonas frigoris TaxID=3096163 RepID=UPI002FC8AD20